MVWHGFLLLSLSGVLAPQKGSTRIACHVDLHGCHWQCILYCTSWQFNQLQSAANVPASARNHMGLCHAKLLLQAGGSPLASPCSYVFARDCTRVSEPPVTA